MRPWGLPLPHPRVDESGHAILGDRTPLGRRRRLQWRNFAISATPFGLTSREGM